MRQKCKLQIFVTGRVSLSEKLKSSNKNTTLDKDSKQSSVANFSIFQCEIRGLKADKQNATEM